MRKIFTFILFVTLSLSLSAQCVLDGTNGFGAEVSSAEVIACLSGCTDECTIQITVPIAMENDWNLTGITNLTIEIEVGGQLIFDGNGSNATDLNLSATSALVINDMVPANNAIRYDGNSNSAIIVIGGGAGISFSPSQFSSIISAGGAYSGGLGVLPVELTRFEAQSRSDKVELLWTTATELNNDYFQIEHSRDGVQFSPVGKVPGVGTTTETVHYDFMHRQPSSGSNYYRLKQVDFDGQFEYSDLIAIEMDIRSGGVKAYPNPTIDRVFIQLEERPEQLDLQLYNLLGQRLDIPFTGADLGWELDLSNLQKGMYALRIAYGGKVLTRQIVKE